MVSNSAARPPWVGRRAGTSLQTVVKVAPNETGASEDVLAGKQRISVLQPGSLQARPEQEFPVSFVYGPTASNEDIVKRTVGPLVAKALEGYNSAVILMGSSTSGKTEVMEGNSRGAVADTGDGIVHLAMDHLFARLREKAAKVGQRVAESRRTGGVKTFDFYLDYSYVELYNETCTDLFAEEGPIGELWERKGLAIVEDADEGWTVQGVTVRTARNAKEIRTDFNEGRLRRDKTITDLGPTSNRSAAILKITLAQFVPHVNPGEEDSVLVSRIIFADTPGAEKLAMEPEVLRLREGLMLNKSLLAFATALRALARSEEAEYVNTEDSLLGKLLHESLGGNSLTCIIGSLAQGQWESSTATMQHLVAASLSKNYPVVNHARSRGLLFKIKLRQLAIMADREMLQDAMEGPDGNGDPAVAALSLAKVRDLQKQRLMDQSEMQELMEEKAALYDRLKRLTAAGNAELEEKSKLQEALIESEEQRLEISRALIDFQLENNEMQEEMEAERYKLEQRILELEAQLLETGIRADRAEELDEERGTAMYNLDQARRALKSSQVRVSDLQGRLDQEGAASSGLAAEVDALRAELSAIAADLEKARQTIRDNEDAISQHMSLLQQVKDLKRRGNELRSDLTDATEELEHAKKAATMNKVKLLEQQTAYDKSYRGQMESLSELAKRMEIAHADPESEVAPAPEDVEARFKEFGAQLTRVANDRETVLEKEKEEYHERFLELKRRFRALYLGYRDLRYQVEDSVAADVPTPHVAHEDDICGGHPLQYLQNDGEPARGPPDMRGIQLWNDGNPANTPPGIGDKKKGRGRKGKSEVGDGDGVIPRQGALALENERLREELDRLRKTLESGSGKRIQELTDEIRTLKRVIAEVERTDKDKVGLAKELARAKEENATLRANKGGARDARKAIREFALNTQQDLETRAMKAESRAVMAEEQLEQLTAYINTATTQYQKEIMKLRNQLAGGAGAPPPVHVPQARGDGKRNHHSSGGDRPRFESLPPTRARSATDRHGAPQAAVNPNPVSAWSGKQL